MDNHANATAAQQTSATASGSAAQYIDLYREQRELIMRHAPAVMNGPRDEAFAHFCCLGFPTKKVERYKYTDMERLFAPNYGLNLGRLPIPVNPYDVFRCDVPNLSTRLFFMVNDAFESLSRCENVFSRSGERGARSENTEQALCVSKESPALSSLPAPRSSLLENNTAPIVTSLKDYAEQHPDFVQHYYGRLAHTADDGVTALNTMLAQDGLLVYVPRGVVVEKAIQVINILRSDVDLMVNRRVLIVVEEGAEATLLFCDHTADDRRFLATQVIEAFVGPAARLDLYCMEETNVKNVCVSNLYIEQQRDSHVNHHIITLHNGVTRNRADVHLRGEGASCNMAGCVIADKQQHVDNNTLIVHETAHCESRELYKYVLDENAVGAFAGKVLVQPGAQQTTSQMTNQNLCATSDARMFTQPMLEIYADDVKCAHGSTVGQLNDAALFYMQQRGIPVAEAKTLLQLAFINEVIDQMRLEPLRDRLHYLVEKRFRGELNKCEGCRLCR